MKFFYELFFYKFYKISEAAPSKWMSEWKALFCISLIFIFCMYLVAIYYSILSRELMFEKLDTTKIILICSFVVIINFIYFFVFKPWNLIIIQFDKFEKKKKRNLNYFFFTFLLFLFIFLIFGFYLMSINPIESMP